MSPFSYIHLQRGLLILAVFLFWVLTVCFPWVHFEPGKWDKVKQGLRETPFSLDFFATFLSAVAAIVLITVLIFAIQRVRRKRKKDDAPHELYREPIPTPWTVYVVITLLFISVPAIVWWARRPPTPAESPTLAEHTSVPEPMQPEKASRESPVQDSPEHGPFVAQMMKYLLALSITGILSWVAVRRIKDRNSELYGEPPDPSLRPAQVVIASEKDVELSDVVLRCYRDMCRILGRKVDFPKEMTSREFIRRCVQAGVPEREVSRLTELFEKVRYGRHIASPGEREESIALLQTVERQQGGPTG